YQADPAAVLANVVVAAQTLAGEGLLVGVGPAKEPDDGAGAGEATAADAGEEEADGPFVAELPTPCMDSSFPLGDAGLLTVKVGEHLLGLRLSTPELVEAARAVLRPSLVDDVRAPNNVSVVETSVRTGTPLLYCYRSGWLMARARSTRRAMEAAIAFLSSYAPPAPGDPVRIDAVVAVRAGAAALLCPESRFVSDGLFPRLRAAGWQVADAPWAAIDASTGEAVIVEPAVEFDAAALAALPGSASEGGAPAPGRYPVRTWLAVAGEALQPGTPAGRVTAVASGAGGLACDGAQAVLEATAAMLRSAEWVVSPKLEVAAIAEVLRGVASS
ncbi:MAG: hypothetical protein ACRDYY_03085, partial [Acidimicrobiales bacterium]